MPRVYIPSRQRSPSFSAGFLAHSAASLAALGAFAFVVLTLADILAPLNR